MDAALPDLFLFDDWRIDCVQNLAWRGKHRVNVEPKAMMVLQYLAARPGIVVTREELFHQFWPNQVVTQDALNRVMSTLRRAFNDNACHPKYIATVRKVGYKLVAPVVTLENPRTKALLEFQAGQESLSGQLYSSREASALHSREYAQVKSLPVRYWYLVCFLVLSLAVLLGLYTLVGFPGETNVPGNDFSAKEARVERAGYTAVAGVLLYFDKNQASVDNQALYMPGLENSGYSGTKRSVFSDPALLHQRVPIVVSIQGRTSTGVVYGGGVLDHHLLEYHLPEEAAQIRHGA